MNYILDYFEKEEIDDISTLFEEKLNLNFDLPIEVPFIDRFEIAVNRKLFSCLQKQSKIFNHNYLNLFRYDLEKINFAGSNPKNFEIVKFKSSVNFDLYGIGVTELNDKETENLEVSIYKGNSLLMNKIEFSQIDEKKSLSIGLFSNPIKIESKIEYSIKFKGIYGLSCIANYEEYNQNSKINIGSSNFKTILACLII